MLGYPIDNAWRKILADNPDEFVIAQIGLGRRKAVDRCVLVRRIEAILKRSGASANCIGIVGHPFKRKDDICRPVIYLFLLVRGANDKFGARVSCDKLAQHFRDLEVENRAGTANRDMAIFLGPQFISDPRELRNALPNLQRGVLQFARLRGRTRPPGIFLKQHDTEGAFEIPYAPRNSCLRDVQLFCGSEGRTRSQHCKEG